MDSFLKDHASETISSLFLVQTTPKAWLFGWFGVDIKQIRYSLLPSARATKDVARVTLEKPQDQANGVAQATAFIAWVGRTGGRCILVFF